MTGHWPRWPVRWRRSRSRGRSRLSSAGSQPPTWRTASRSTSSPSWRSHSSRSLSSRRAWGRPGRALTRPAVLLLLAFCLADWVLIEDLGVFGGLGTDPNSMIPVALLAVAGYLALMPRPRPSAASCPGGTTRPGGPRQRGWRPCRADRLGHRGRARRSSTARGRRRPARTRTSSSRRPSTAARPRSTSSRPPSR